MKISFDIASNVEIIRRKVYDNLQNSARRLIASISFPKNFVTLFECVLIL